MLRRVRLRLLLPLLLLVATPTVRGQPTVDIKLQGREVFVNEPFPLIVEISNYSEEAATPEFPRLPGATISTTPGQSSSFYQSIINGRITAVRSISYRYEVTPLQVGTLTIPPIRVLVDDGEIESRPVELTVLPSDADQYFAVEITANRQRIYVGQRVRLTLTIWVRPARYGGQWLRAGDMIRLINPINFGPFPPRYSNSGATVRQRVVEGEPLQFYAFDFDTEFVVSRPGQLAFDEIEVAINYPTREGERHFRKRPTVQPLEILTVPEQGRPPKFNGAVGVFDIETRATPSSVRVGDPIELTIDLFGDGPVDTLPPPVLEAHPRLVENFRLPSETLAGEMVNSRRRYRVTIRAQDDRVREIPPLEYPYFDPDAERFVVARSEPIPLEVAPAAEVAPPIVPQPGTPGRSNGETLEALDGLHDIETSEVALLTTTSLPSVPLVAATMLAPPTFFGLTWAGLALLRVQNADPARRRRQAALKAARSRIAAARGQPPTEAGRVIGATLSQYLADRLNQPPARFAGAHSVELLRQRNVNPDLAARWEALVGRCDEVSFGGGTEADTTALVEEAQACLAAVERVKL